MLNSNFLYLFEVNLLLIRLLLFFSIEVDRVLSGIAPICVNEEMLYIEGP